MTTGNTEMLGSADLAPQSFVINLCSSTSPMALAHPSSPELKRYTFFVSRQREDGRERFRLHMGYFGSQDDAEQLLLAVRDVYPAAWAGPAPTQGVARRGRIAPVQLAPAVAKAANAAVVAPAAPVAAQSAAAPDTLEQTMSEMRSVLARLGDEDPTEVAPQLAAAHVDPPRLRPVAEPRVADKPAAPAAELTPVQTLQVLETESRAVAPAAPAPEGKVRVLTPEDTQTLTDIRLDKENNAPPCFAVQLVWSVAPIDAAALPHLAIFDAYTLYNVEGNRQGRKWYGLRLGFFSDPNSATQVANYVRSDYASVAVVPVANKEKDRARGGSPVSPADSGINPPLKPAEQLSTNRETMEGFELVADERPMPQKRDLDAPADPKAVARAAVRAKLDKILNPPVAAPGRVPVALPVAAPVGRSSGKRVVVRRRPDATVKGSPGTADVLESTLDLLGASTLTLDEGGGRAVDEAVARRDAAGKKASNGRFSKLLSRLGGG